MESKPHLYRQDEKQQNHTNACNSQLPIIRIKYSHNAFSFAIRMSSKSSPQFLVRRPNQGFNISIDQFPVSQIPQDAIAALKFSPHPNSMKFAVASWDRSVYLYELQENRECKQIFKSEHQAPVLDVCFGKDDNELYSACLDWTIRR